MADRSNLRAPQFDLTRSDFGLTPPSVQGMTHQNIQTNLKFLDFQRSGTPPSPFTAQEADHLNSVTDAYISDHPLGFLAAQSPIIAEGMGHEALRRDTFRQLTAYTHASGNFDHVEDQIVALQRTARDDLAGDVSQILDATHRNVMTEIAASRRQIISLIDQDLWGTSEADEQRMREQFYSTVLELDKAIDLMDIGESGAALEIFNSALAADEGFSQWFQRAHERSEVYEFAGHLGTTAGAAAITLLTSGAATPLLATAVGAASTGLGYQSLGTLVSGLAFTISLRSLNHLAFDTPVFPHDSPVANAADFAGETAINSLLFGWMGALGAFGKALPKWEGDPLVAAIVNGGTGFSYEVGGLTFFNTLASPAGLVSDRYPRIEEVLSPSGLAQTLAFLGGLKAGNLALASSVHAGQLGKEWVAHKTSEAREALTQLAQGIPRPEMGLPLMVFMQAETGIQQLVRGGQNVFRRAGDYLADIYFGQGELPTAKKIPLALISSTNILLSFICMNAVRYGLQAWDGQPTEFWPTGKLAETFEKNGYGFLALLGGSLLIPSLANGISRLKLPRGDLHWGKWQGLKAWELMARGGLGLTRVVGDRFSDPIAAIQGAKTFLKSAPTSRLLMGQASTPEWAGRMKAMASVPDFFLNFAGTVMPDTGGRFLGFGIDLFVNSSISLMNSYIINKNMEWWPAISTGLAITSLMAFANVRITQHQGFNPTQVLGARTVLGVGKGAVYGGVNATTGIVSPWANWLLQLGYGLLTMRIAESLVKRFPPIGPVPPPERISEASSAQFEAAAQALQRAQAEGRPMRIVVVESGLGGTTTSSEIVRQLEQGSFAGAEFSYYNSLEAKDSGIHAHDKSDRVGALNQALTDVVKRHRPDLIILDDHTLSNLFPRTSFANTTDTAVFRAIPPTVDLMAAGLQKYPNAKVVIMGSPTTVESGIYQQALKDLRVPSSRVMTDECLALGLAIEEAPYSRKTTDLITAHADHIAKALKDPTTPVIITLAHTQLGLVKTRIENALRRAGLVNVTILDPTPHLIATLETAIPKSNSGSASGAVTVRVDSFFDIRPLVDELLSLEGTDFPRSLREALKNPHIIEPPFPRARPADTP